MMKHSPLFDDRKNVFRSNNHVFLLSIGIFLLKFSANAINIGIFFCHFLCLKFQTSGFTLNYQFIMSLTQLAHAINNFITGIDVQALCHSHIVLPSD